jgi:hypothetical protein
MTRPAPRDDVPRHGGPLPPPRKPPRGGAGRGGVARRLRGYHPPRRHAARGGGGPAGTFDAPAPRACLCGGFSGPSPARGRFHPLTDRLGARSAAGLRGEPDPWRLARRAGRRPSAPVGMRLDNRRQGRGGGGVTPRRARNARPATARRITPRRWRGGPGKGAMEAPAVAGRLVGAALQPPARIAFGVPSVIVTLRMSARPTRLPRTAAQTGAIATRRRGKAWPLGRRAACSRSPARLAGRRGGRRPVRRWTARRLPGGSCATARPGRAVPPDPPPR